MRFRDLKLGVKQGLGFGSILLIMAGVNAFSLTKMGQLKDEVDNVTHDWLRRVSAISDINLGTAELQFFLLQLASGAQKQYWQEEAQRMVSLVDRINENRDIYEGLLAASEAAGGGSGTERRLYERFDIEWDQYQGTFMEILGLLMEDRQDEALGLINGAARQHYNASSVRLKELVRISRDNAFEAAEQAEWTYNATRSVLELLFMAAILLSVGLTLVLVRLVAVPVRQLERAADAVARGETDLGIDFDSRDEIGNLSRSFCKMTAEIRGQQEALRANNQELRQQSTSLAQQKEEIERQNSDLEETLDRLREAQQQLIIKEKMASLGNLVAGVAHEINNPLGAINSTASTADLSAKRIAEIIDQAADIEQVRQDRRFNRALEALRKGTRTIMMAGERISRIVRSLRDFARLDEAEFQMANLHEGLDSTLTLLDHELKGRIEVERQYGQIPQVTCFPNQLNQVFMNVLANAAQAIKGPGRITITTRQQGDEVFVEIADTGGGIPDDLIDKIFDPGVTTKGVGVGTGLGLSISYNIVERHKGRFEVESKVGEGSTFRIVLPVRLKEQKT